MLGAMIGDIVGSVYEFNNIKTMDFPLWHKDCIFTDDTIMTAAVAKALMASDGLSQRDIKKSLIQEMRYFGRKYPNAGYGARFRAWLDSEQPLAYNSWGNGSAMRVSPVGWLYGTLDVTLTVAKLSAEVTHNHPQGIAGAQSVAAAIFLLRNGKTKDEVRNYIRGVFNYDFRQSIEDIRPNYTFNESCQGSVPQAMTAFFEATDFEDCLRKAISLGGDSDTIAAIACSIAEAHYEIPAAIITEALKRLDQEILVVYQEFLRRKR